MLEGDQSILNMGYATAQKTLQMLSPTSLIDLSKPFDLNFEQELLCPLLEDHCISTTQQRTQDIFNKTLRLKSSL
jgi:hypothetical protein